MTYELKVAVLISVFYMFYRLLLSRDSLHQLNRFVLLGTAVASFVLPLCVITIHHTEILTSAPTSSGVVSGLAAANAEMKTLWWQTALEVVFWAGVIITLSYTFLSISKVCILISRCEKHRQPDGTVIAVSDGEVSPFSWMHYIVMSRSDYAHPDRAILMHEREHIRRHHSWDVLLVDILTSLQWFNPAMWMLRSDLRAIHEYEADAAVLSGGVDARQYQYLLVRKAMASAGYSVANGINHSTLKQRITMMNIKKQSKYSWLKALYILPIVAVSLVASAGTVTDYKVAAPQAPDVVERTAAPVVKAASQTPAQPQPMTVEAAIEQQGGDSDSLTLSQALVIIDGKEYPYRILGQLSPNDIVSITILKDKNAAKYGDKGKNGVIEVKTKSGNAAEEIARAERGKVYDVAQTMPQFPGGYRALADYIASHINYPAEAKAKGIQGRVVVSFIVNADGTVSNPTVVRSIDPQLDAEAIRCISEMPTWTPGLQDGTPVAVKYNVPVSFKL